MQRIGLTGGPEPGDQKVHVTYQRVRFIATLTREKRSNLSESEVVDSTEATMKTIIFTLIAILGLSTFAAAQSPDRLELKAGKEKTASRSKLKIKFISVLEDSRCPTGTQCVWAGNAKVKIRVTSKRMGTKEFELNTGMGAQGDQFDGYAINLESLTPSPTVNGKIDPKKYKAKLTITRLTR